ncbi:alpha-L-arabinofuranosidase C-terminal domain-containing protein [Streptomyces sp. NPDC005538]|uniref:alpha-L-arabinofuranosidase C-terminal domain-containing protein n=1 Tax=unclassified Streptomyces TaxID=2593676 RepID=UPI0033B70894
MGIETGSATEADSSLTPTSIVVDTRAPGRTISRDLWGIFFEDINYSADGGLYGELVQNRSFDYSARDRPDWHALTGWSVCAEPADAGEVTLRTENPVAPQSSRYAVLRTSAPAGSVALVNEGFDGISVTEGGSYRFSVYARSFSGAPAALRVELTDEDGELIADLGFPSVTGPWESYEGVLTADRSCAAARLVLSVDAPAEVGVDFVSLFPTDTFAGERNGLRRDLAEAIAELKPRFVRFPGGCVAHGLGLENMYRWKDTIGELPSRRQNFNIWGYHQSMGIGYFEYFRFCERIGAKPLPVLAAGVCCQNTEGGPRAIPDDEMDDYVQEVLDLVEFANGPSDSLWGARRAELGHPEPFGLEYLAIGNEDKINAVFRNRFERIYQAVRGKHPELTLIGTAGPSPFGDDYEQGWSFARDLAVDLVDEHSYKSPKWFFENLDRFDAYDRGGPGVYLGEYGSKGNTMLNALAEAAYMMGMERNGDIVRLASYAPLLAKVDRTQWVPDLIYFDNERVLPSLNYYVQQMHATAVGDRSLPVAVTGAPQFTRPPQREASVSVRAADADVTFTGLRLNGSEPLSAAVDAETTLVRFPVSTDDEDYTITLQARQTRGDEGFAVAFGDVDGPDHFEWSFGTWKNRFLSLYYRADGDLDEAVEPIPFSVETDRLYDLEIRVQGRGRRITCLLDSVVVHDVTSPDRIEERFSATAVRDSDTGTVHVKIVNATDQTVRTSLALTGVTGATDASRTTLAAYPGAGAAFEPAPAVPVGSRCDLSEPVSVEPYSFTILSLPA